MLERNHRLSHLGAALGAFSLAAVMAMSGCAMPGDADVELDEEIGSLDQAVYAPLAQAYCTVDVGWVGNTKDMETDYLPRVVACENGAADGAALRAQAIAARTTAYYYMGTQGYVCDSQACQVYTCGAQPQAKHHQAVADTAGQYLMYNNTVVYGFYVAGDPWTSGPSCVGNTANHSTEKYVTYNQGRTGSDVQQTSLGWVHPANYANRGCMSQNGSKCLSNGGYSHSQILRFYYGADIIIEQAPGWCVGTPSNPPAKPTGLSPDNWVNVGSSSAYLTWNTASGATSYDVVKYYWDGSQWVYYYTWNTANTYFQVWPVYHDTYYAWAVVAKNSAGSTWSDWAYYYFD
jgi:hypothetical protein